MRTSCFCAALVCGIVLISPVARGQATPFDGCGLLVAGIGPVCQLMRGDDTLLYRLNDTAGYLAGDRVRVRGFIPGICPIQCGEDNCITIQSITRCPDDFRDCGVLEQFSPGCLIFRPSDGRSYVLQNYGGFGPGELVHVAGHLLPCDNLCGDCIVNNSIGHCFNQCGLITRLLNQDVLRADDGQTYLVENLASFHAIPRVRVVGRLEPCSPWGGCVWDNTVSTCRGDFVECGRLVQGAEGCILFRPLLSDPGDYLLDNLAGYGVGDFVRVAGALDAGCASFCFVPCVRNNWIGPGCPADLNCDGAINNFDIDAFVLALVNPAEYGLQYPNCDVSNADTNDDGVVDNFDIDSFVHRLTGG